MFWIMEWISIGEKYLWNRNEESRHSRKEFFWRIANLGCEYFNATDSARIGSNSWRISSSGTSITVYSAWTRVFIKTSCSLILKHKRQRFFHCQIQTSERTRRNLINRLTSRARPIDKDRKLRIQSTFAISQDCLSHNYWTASWRYLEKALAAPLADANKRLHI